MYVYAYCICISIIIYYTITVPLTVFAFFRQRFLEVSEQFRITPASHPFRIVPLLVRSRLQYYNIFSTYFPRRLYCSAHIVHSLGSNPNYPVYSSLPLASVVRPRVSPSFVSGRRRSPC